MGSGVRFCALDWHSLDRTDKPHDAFLTMLPKHFFDPLPPAFMEAMTKGMPEEKAAAMKGMMTKMTQQCPRSISDGAGVLRAVIEQGLGWGVGDKTFMLGIKSWSGAIGIGLLADAAREDGEFKKNIVGAAIMHPACFDVSEVTAALTNMPTILARAKDDAKVPFKLSVAYTALPNVKLVAYEKGGHHNFDGTCGLPNFDDEIVAWFREQTGVGGLISEDGRLSNDYVLGRMAANTAFSLETVPQLADLTTEITCVDGKVLTQLVLSGFAKMNTKINELNKINVFPIADNDTGANMKICLKKPTRNLLLNPSDSVLTVASNLAADVLINGQGNSGTILSHFFISMAEELSALDKHSLTIDEFAAVLTASGDKMNGAVSNPVEGTLLSVARDGCFLIESGPFATLRQLLEKWAAKANEELAKTPDQLIVDGVKVLEKAGVVDSGAQGFVYLVDGMLLAAKGELPGVADPSIFKSTGITNEEVEMKVDHTVTDSKFQYCTEAVVLLKEGVDKSAVLESITAAAEDGLGDSIACVGAPANQGGNMVKVHIHSNKPGAVFEHLCCFSRESLLRKEKVENMFAEREAAHGNGNVVDLSNAKFSIVGLCSLVLSEQEIHPETYTVPVLLVWHCELCLGLFTRYWRMGRKHQLGRCLAAYLWAGDTISSDSRKQVIHDFFNFNYTSQ